MSNTPIMHNQSTMIRSTFSSPGRVTKSPFASTASSSSMSLSTQILTVRPDSSIQPESSTTPAESAEPEQKLLRLVQNAVASFTIPSSGTFLISRVPDSTSKEYNITRVTTKGEVIEYNERVVTNTRIERLTLTRPTILSLSLFNLETVFLATTNEWKTLEVVHVTSPAHKHFYLSKYISETDHLSVSYVMKDDMAVFSADKSVKLGVNLDLVKTVSDSLWSYLNRGKD